MIATLHFIPLAMTHMLRSVNSYSTREKYLKTTEGKRDLRKQIRDYLVINKELE